MKTMVMQVDDSRGETLFRVNVQTVLIVILAVLSALGAWNVYLQNNQVAQKEVISKNCTDIAVLQAEDNHLKGSMSTLTATVDKMYREQDLYFSLREPRWKEWKQWAEKKNENGKGLQ